MSMQPAELVAIMAAISDPSLRGLDLPMTEP
jgi:hypothetical protein